MKLLSSASSSAASTATSSSASSNGRSLAGLLRKLLCFNSLPTNPADQLNDTGFDSGELDNFVCLETEAKVGDNTANPGIVARLMGLESMPQNDSAKNQMTPNRIARCRSMNYDSRRENESQNRRVKTSLSFRELPTFLELENDDFLVLSFESEVESKETRSKATRSEMGSRKLVKRGGERSKSKCGRRVLPGPEEKDKENQEPNKVVSIDKVNRRIDQNAVTQLKPVTVRENCSGRIRRKENEEIVSASKKVETECDSKNSSPVSVLDFSEPIMDPQVPTSGLFSMFCS